MAVEMERDEIDMLAAEYALRLLEGEDLRAATALMLTNPEFAKAVTDWETRLADLADEVEPVQPAAPRNEVFMTRTEGAAPEGRILQVWAHGPNAPAVSVGLWPEGESVRLAMPAVIAAVEGTLTLGVSEEPPGGSETGSPSGRVFGTVDIPGVTAE